MAETAPYTYQSLIVKDNGSNVVIGNFMETMARMYSGQLAVRAECVFLRNKPDKRYGGSVFLPEAQRELNKLLAEGNEELRFYLWMRIDGRTMPFAGVYGVNIYGVIKVRRLFFDEAEIHSLLRTYAGRMEKWAPVA